MSQLVYQGFEINDSHVANIDEAIYSGEYNPGRIRAWLIYGPYGVLAVAFASNESDALDAAFDAGKLESLRLSQDDVAERVTDGLEYSIVCLGNYGEPCELNDVGIVELPTPRRSWVAEFAASNEPSEQEG